MQPHVNTVARVCYSYLGIKVRIRCFLDREILAGMHTNNPCFGYFYYCNVLLYDLPESTLL